ncbi:MAG: hypothetical protein ACP5NY_03200 [Thermocladium sp.]
MEGEETAIYHLPWVLNYEQGGGMGGELIITNDRLIFWGTKKYVEIGTFSGTHVMKFLRDINNVKPFADRLEGLKNGTYNGKLFSAKDAELGKSLKDIEPELSSFSQNAKHVNVTYYSDVSEIRLFDVLTPTHRGLQRGALSGVVLNKSKSGLFSKTLLAYYDFPFLNPQELAEMLKRTPLANREFIFEEARTYLNTSLRK